MRPSNQAPAEAGTPSERNLERIRKEIRESPEPQARLYNQWGDAARDLDRMPEALAAYGYAIDSYIKAGSVRMAIAMCQKVIRNHPYVTRTHFTLCCLVLSRSLVRESLRALEAYTTASRLSRTEAVAIPRLRFFTGLVEEPSIRQAIARSLAALGDPEGERRALAPPPPLPPGHEADDRSSLMLEAATAAADDLWAKFWLR